jgi:phosphate/sulfate permease
LFRSGGGAIQKIVTSKTNVTDIRSATVVVLVLGLILLVFKELSNMPMSTTWVFVGLLAGRELAITYVHSHRSMSDSGRLVASDLTKATTGLLLSIGLALAIPFITSL